VAKIMSASCKIAAFLVLLGVVLSLGGCASQADPDERAFFYEGWWKPKKHTLQTP